MEETDLPAQLTEGEPTGPRPLVTFFLLTYVVTWVSWLAAWAISGGGFARPGVGMLFFYIGVFAPSFVAVWLTARREGRARVDALLRRLIQWRVGLRWYLFALTYIAAIKLAGALIHHLAAGDLSAASDRRRFIGLTATRVQSPSPVI